MKRRIMLEPIDSGALSALVLTSGLAVVLVGISLRSKLLEIRQPKHCVACGRLLTRGNGCQCQR
jgi:hypothetical protein